MPIVVLLDTNVWVSALINPRGHPAQVIRAWMDERFQVVVSAELLDELADVLSRPRIADKYHVNKTDVAELLLLLAARALKVIPTGDLRVCRDPEDDFVLETALLGHAQHLVSRDDDIKRDPILMAQLEARGVSVLSVGAFLQTLGLDTAASFRPR